MNKGSSSYLSLALDDLHSAACFAALAIPSKKAVNNWAMTLNFFDSLFARSGAHLAIKPMLVINHQCTANVQAAFGGSRVMAPYREATFGLMPGALS
jgi:hypothetical protein